MRRTAAMITAGAMILLGGCSGNDAPRGSTDGEPAAKVSAAAEVPAPEVSLALADGSADVSPVVPLEISVPEGDLDAVTLVDAAGAPIAGSIQQQDGADTAVWAPETPLAYGTSYSLTATAVNEKAEQATATSTFTTVTPAAVSTPGIGPLDGQTVGVGMPIRVYFDDPVVDKAGVESHLQVTSTPATDGVWSWFGDSEVHFRPSTYWPANTQVRLDANLYGIDFGGGTWGEKNRTVSFSIGAKHVSIADASTHTMEVYDGDQLVQTFPISAGSPENPSYNGAHVVTEMNRDRVMDSSTYGVPVDSPDGYRTPVEYAVRISDSGEFVHAAPWSVAQQGNSNVSHGCINLSTERAAWFFDFTQPGDVVEIRGSSAGTLSSPVYDWTIPWEDWQAGSALK